MISLGLAAVSLSQEPAPTPVPIPAPYSLSTTLRMDVTTVLLFPGDSVKGELEVIAHPEGVAVWKDVQVRLTAAGMSPPEEGKTPPPDPVKLTVAHAVKGNKISLKLNQWYPASTLGLSPQRRTLPVTIEFQEAANDALQLSGEVDSPAADAASTAPLEVRCAQLKLTDLRDVVVPQDDILIPPGGTAWLTQYESEGRSMPIMPRLVARVQGLPASFTVQWLLQNSYGRRSPLDDIVIPGDVWEKLPGDQAWKIFGSFEERYFGGEAKLSYRIYEKSGQAPFRTGTHSFSIRSLNPGDEGVRNYIEQKSGRFWFAWAIAQHESRQGRKAYNQFNSGGRVANEPNFGPPDGWGLFQIDSARGMEVKTEEVWDWRLNVAGAMGEFRQCVRDTKNYFDAVKRTYPRQWEEPPSTYTPPGCKTALTYEEASIIQCYNGAAVIRKMRNSYNTWSYYRSCWAFDPSAPSGKRWRFVENRNKYVWKIVRHEIEGGIPVEE